MCIRYRVLLVVALFASISIGCGGSPAEAVAHAVKNQPDAKSFAALFPNAEHFITHYTGTAGLRIWNSHVLLHDRYVLTMQFNMALGSDGIKVTATAPPEYYLREVTSATPAPSGQVSISYGDSIEFGSKEWKTLEAANGDLSALGIKPKTDQPVPNLRANWRGG